MIINDDNSILYLYFKIGDRWYQVKEVLTERNKYNGIVYSYVVVDVLSGKRFIRNKKQLNSIKYQELDGEVKLIPKKKYITIIIDDKKLREQ